MDSNQNNLNGQDGNRQWDRWNSSASHNSYYNQPTHRPYGQAFAIASFVCGLMSISVGLCGIGLPLGALGILFAVLSRRKGRHMSGTCTTGLILSVMGGILSLALIVAAQLMTPVMLRQQLSDETSRQQLETMYNSLFKDSLGMDFEDYLGFLEKYYGITVEE